MLKIGIIGTGRMAEIRANALQSITNARLYSVASPHIENAKKFAEKYNALAKENAFDDISSMLNDPGLDAVVIASPTIFHAEHILQAMQMNKPILVEKPICSSIESRDELLAAWQKSNIFLAVGYQLRWHEGLRQIAQKAHAGELGEIHHMKLHWAVDFPGFGWKPKSYQGQWLCLTALGTHLIDIVRWIMVPQCGEVTQIKSFIKNIELTKTFDGTLTIIMRFASGDTAEIFCSVVFNAPFKLEIFGNRQTVLGTHLLNPSQSVPEKILINDQPLVYENSDPYLNESNAFVQAVLDKKAPEVSFEEGIKNFDHLVSVWNENI